MNPYVNLYQSRAIDVSGLRAELTRLFVDKSKAADACAMVDVMYRQLIDLSAISTGKMPKKLLSDTDTKTRKLEEKLESALAELIEHKAKTREQQVEISRLKREAQDAERDRARKDERTTRALAELERKVEYWQGVKLAPTPVAEPQPIPLEPVVLEPVVIEPIVVETVSAAPVITEATVDFSAVNEPRPYESVSPRTQHRYLKQAEKKRTRYVHTRRGTMYYAHRKDGQVFCIGPLKYILDAENILAAIKRMDVRAVSSFLHAATRHLPFSYFDEFSTKLVAFAPDNVVPYTGHNTEIINLCVLAGTRFPNDYPHIGKQVTATLLGL